ncbi:MAG: NTP transferase domain-containing protein [Proteobacteria bacterium]|nr:NTP transferase domain-containing protein [Pseudomonadota bacterium]
MIVIPMAGASRRFAEAGYGPPKYMLPLAGRPLFDWAVLSFAGSFAHDSFLFILRDVAGTRDFVAARARALGLARWAIAELDGPTAGQAETVELGLVQAGVAGTEPLAIFNIDTIRPGLDPAPIPGTDGWLEVFSAPGDNWSFIEPDPADPQRVIRCTEKQRISDHCCTGLYQFASAALFAEALAAERAAPSSHELFVAPLYNHLIARGARIGWREAPADRVILSGVPAEYEALLAELPAALRTLGPAV